MTRTTVSFIIPTLNRGHYVVRAVASCLSAAARMPDVEVQVVVLDSMSDDGSWQLLVDRFTTDSRVVLAQNARGLGPTRSWLDGARLVTGDYVTFLWSDDYVAPDFLIALLPPLREGGCGMAMGNGVIRDIDDESPLPGWDRSIAALAGTEFLRRHLGLRAGPVLPVSPAAALFVRRVFDRWMVAVEQWCTMPGVRHDIMWRRAIGPDLMLFLTAAIERGDRVAVGSGTVAQFSSHSQSISMSSSPWPLRAGYWLAKKWAVEQVEPIDPRLAAAGYARLALQGQMLTRQVGSDMAPTLAGSFAAEVSAARSAVLKIRGPLGGMIELARSALALAKRVAMRKVRG